MAIQKKHYDIEKQGQCDFFDNYRIDYQGNNSILVDNTDGVYHGNIMEFKLNINNTGKVLFQAIKYLSRMRIKGESIPARILLVDLNATKIYVYNSVDYIEDIHKELNTSIYHIERNANASILFMDLSLKMFKLLNRKE